MPDFLTLDIIILACVFIVFIITSLKFGKSVLAAFIIAFYPTLLIFENITQLQDAKDITKIGVFVGIYAASFYICGKVTSTYYSYISGHKYLQAVVMSTVCTSLILYIYYFILPLNKYHNFGSSIDSIFNEKIPPIAWLTIPLIAIFISNKD